MSGRVPTRVWQSAPAAATAAVILVQAALARMLLSADESRVYWVGRPIDLACAFRARFGLPCPACGLTRSVVLALHGQFLRAWNVAPGGAAGVAGALAFALGLAALAILGARGGSAADRFRARFGRYALVAAAVVFAVWCGGWATAFAAALHRHS